MASNGTAILLILIIMGGIGVYFYGTTMMSMWTNSQVSSDAKTAALTISVTVVDNGYSFNFGLNDPLTKVIFYQGPGTFLSVGGRPSVDWQITLAHADNPFQGSGDPAGVILKMAKLSANGAIQYEVGCLGTYVKKVYFGTTLKLDMNTGARWVTWSA